MSLPDVAAARIDDLIARTQAQGRTPCLVAAVVRDGQVLHATGAGDGPIDELRDVQFRVGSISKTFTAMLVLNLRDEGALRLDDRLDDHLPGTGAGGARLRELLAHVAGLQREPDGLWWERNPGSALDALLARVGPDKVAFPAYQRHHYSNLAYGLLGGVIERVTGRGWWDNVSARLLVPREMTRTTYHPQEPFARGYVVHPIAQVLREEPRHDAGAMAPAGQLWSTVDDMARWAAGLAAPEAAEMAAPVTICDPDAWTSGAGLGVQLWRDGERVYVGHTGSMPGYLAVLMTHRPTGFGAVAFANSYTVAGATIGGLGQAILRIVLDHVPPGPPTAWRAAPPPPARVAALCGQWWWMGKQFAVRWDPASEHLIVAGTAPGAAQWHFVEEAPGRWRGLTGDQAGEVLTVIGTDPVVALDIATFVFTRDPLPADDPADHGSPG